MKRLIALLCVAAFAATILAPSASLARKKKRGIYWYEYSVPFTCGSNATDPGRILTGDHATVIQAINAGTANATVYVGLALTYPTGALFPGWVSDRVAATLPAGAASQASCQDALDLQNQIVPPPFPIPPYAQGFATIQSSIPLTVQQTHSVEMPGGQIALTNQAIPGRRIVRPPAP
ncbi:MAG: hypothetical protein JRH01_10875 [Deltaproteobacteria bacterium]|nr:hypothetical protein [Deltaproteobacteria bacterium]MBW2394573.1 hypothetical protein [Deltaproteobacteria bacterium]